MGLLLKYSDLHLALGGGWKVNITTVVVINTVTAFLLFFFSCLFLNLSSFSTLFLSSMASSSPLALCSPARGITHVPELEQLHCMGG